MDKPIIKVVIDIGNSRVRAVIAEFIPGEAHLEILAVGVSNRVTLNHGVIINASVLTAAVREAVNAAENATGLIVQSAVIGISNASVFGMNLMDTVSPDSAQVRENDVIRLVDMLRKKTERARPDDALLHILQRQFTADDKGIDNPVGSMKIQKLKLQAFVISAAIATIENLRHSVEQAGVIVEDIVYNGLASSYSACTDNEREQGVCSVNLGAGTVDTVVWYDGCPVVIFTLPVGGEDVSGDLANGLITFRQQAEILKCQHGCMLPGEDTGEDIRILSTGNRPDRMIPAAQLSEIILASYQRIFAGIRQVIREWDICNLPGGMVFTGNAAQIPGLAEEAGQLFSFDVRVAGTPVTDGLPDLFQQDAGMITALGILKLKQFPLKDHIWAKEMKDGIIKKLWDFGKRHILMNE